MCIKLVEKELKNIVLMGLNDKGYISVKNIIWALKHLKKKKSVKKIDVEVVQTS